MDFIFLAHLSLGKSHFKCSLTTYQTLCIYRQGYQDNLRTLQTEWRKIQYFQTEWQNYHENIEL